MSIDKFRFVSPGVFVNEIDESVLPKVPEEMGPVVIGRSTRGPVMRPVKVQDFNEFVQIFGEPNPGGTGGDVWRDGNKTAPTYGSYAAQAYLKNSGPLTFVRLAGYQNEGATLASGQNQNGSAGWSARNAYGIFVMPVTQSNGNANIVTSVTDATASLAAILYGTGNENDFAPELVGPPLSGSAETTVSTGSWVRGVESGKVVEFKLKIGGVTQTVNFNESSERYIRSVLNCNPILTNTSIADPKKTYFLGETFKTWVDYTKGTATRFAVCLIKLKDFNDHYQEASDAETGWVVSQHKGPASSFAATNGEYPVQKLFQFVGLSEGEWNSQNIKISIEDIKESTNQYSKWGSFSVGIRKMTDNDLTPQYLERFTNLNLDPSSPNYIAKKIGDKYTEWDYNEKLFKEFGTYNNKSKFIRVKVDSSVDAGLVDQDLVPFGFYGPATFLPYKFQGSNLTEASIPYLSHNVTGNVAYTASFELPRIPMIEDSSKSVASSFSSLYFGFKTSLGLGASKRHNADIIDLVRSKPLAFSNNSLTSSFLFTLDDVSGSVVSGALVQSTGLSWAEGNRLSGDSLSAQTTSSVIGGETTVTTYRNLLLSAVNRFTMPLLGGSDGVNIFEKDPFNKRVLETTPGEFTNYAYNSVKVAIEAVADPEVVECNMMTIPGVENEGLTNYLIDKCETRGDALAIVDLPGDYIPEEGKANASTKPSERKPKVSSVVSAIKNRALNTSYGCAFFPWVLAKDTINNNTVWIPPSIAALGTMSSSQKKTELWFAPAGFNRGGLSDGSAGLPVIQTSLRLTSKDRDDLYASNINPIATFPAEGIVIFGQKTLQVTPSALDRINVRRLMIYVKKEVSRFASSVLFDPNVQVTWKRFTDQANPFLASVKSRFGLEEFKVVLDSTTTTQDLIDRNIVYAKILLKPTRAIEFIALDFVITNNGAAFAD